MKVRRGCGEEIPLVQGKEQRLCFAGAVVKRYPMSKERWLRQCRRADRSYSTFKVRRGGGEEIPLVQSKRNPSKMVGVARGHQREDTLKP